MYTNYFHLKQAPFSIAPDPRYLFMSERHREALAHLLYGVKSGGGFVLLTGEIGAGKTTVCRCFIEQVPDDCRLAYIFNPKLTVEELLQTICDEFRIAVAPGDGATAGVKAGVKAYVDAINAYLLDSHARGHNNVLVIDEAQNLSAQVLEQLRLLTNLETSERKLLQIILIGQPELRTMLAQPELEQLAQRVIARYHLGALSVAETGAYVAHRLAVAGAQGAAPIPAALAPLIHRMTDGVPRRINLLCDRALLGAYVENSREMTPPILRRAAREVFAGEGLVAGGAPRARTRWPSVAGGVLAGAALSAAAWQLVPHVSAPVSGQAPTAATAAARGGASGPSAAALSAPGVVAAPGARSAAASSSVAPSAAAPSAAASPAPSASASSAPSASAAAAPSASPAAAPSASAAAASSALPAAAAAATAPAAGVHPLALATQAQALRELGTLWGLDLPAGAPCDAAPRLGVRCYQGRGGLYELRLLDRPAIVALHDGPRIGYAILAALDDGTATLTVGGQPHTVSLAALAMRIDGEFTTLWKAPRAFRDQVGAGDSGPDVDWIAARLAELDGKRAAPPPGQALDEPTRRLLRAFQVRQNLKADGLAGPRTYMRLNQLTGVAEPRLLAATGK